MQKRKNAKMHSLPAAFLREQSADTNTHKHLPAHSLPP